MRYFYIALIFASASVLVRSENHHRHYSRNKMIQLREKVREMFQHAYEGYLQYASNYDELRPLTCDGIDTWGSYQLTLIDSLDTLATMGNFSEFRRVALLLEQMDFDKDINVSVFETTIRIVGGLLAAHLLSKRAGSTIETGWPCQGPLLRMAEDVARRLLPAFDTATGMPYGTVNLRHGVPKGETSVTCTAGVGTFLVEFGTLSRLTGNPIYEEVAVNAIYSLWEHRSPIGLFGNHIDVQTGRWTALDAGIGAGVDSFFEYLVKGSILLNRPELMKLFHDARQAIDKYLKRDDWYIWAGMNKGQITLPVFQSLEAFWPGLLSMTGDIGPAVRSMSKYSGIWNKYGFLPEFYNIPAGEASVNREGYPLRPELVESAMYLYRATKNQFFLELGEQILESIEFSAKTKCGYATIRNVVTHEKENRMESFFLSETTKYMYLLFDEDNFLHNDAGIGERLEARSVDCVIHAGAYIFNTEGHPVDMSALHCCHDTQEDIYDGLDLERFRDDALLKVEREKRWEAEAENPKYQCADGIESEPESFLSGKAEKSTNSDSGLAVDIEVFDESNNPAGEVLVESFERIKIERQQASNVQKAITKNQLTVQDLEDFFKIEREYQTGPEDMLKIFLEFMRNYTLDAGFISGLQLFDKNISSVLGAAVQKEFEGQTRSLWDLYIMQQRYAINSALVTELGIMPFDDENRELLQNVLKALNKTNSTEVEEPTFTEILQKVNLARSKFGTAMVNTTAMQEFLLKILINGTMQKKRTFKALLEGHEIESLAAKAKNDSEGDKKLFANIRRIVEFKKRIMEFFEKFATGATETPSKTTTPSGEGDELIATVQEANVKEKYKTPAQSTNELKAEEIIAKDAHKAPNVSNDDYDDDSVWSQLIQTILRKTTTQRGKFDQEILLQKTRQSLQKYQQRVKARYELFTCQRPKFIEHFAYREFYP